MNVQKMFGVLLCMCTMLVFSGCFFAIDQCGDGRCGASEDSDSCPADCDVSTPCGDGICSQDEDAFSCPADCTDSQLCTDSDGGINDEIEGTTVVRFDKTETYYYDSCATKTTVTEYSCDSDGNVVSEDIFCGDKSMICDSGACMTTQDFCGATLVDMKDVDQSKPASLNSKMYKTSGMLTTLQFGKDNILVQDPILQTTLQSTGVFSVQHQVNAQRLDAHSADLAGVSKADAEKSASLVSDLLETEQTDADSYIVQLEEKPILESYVAAQKKYSLLFETVDAIGRGQFNVISDKRIESISGSLQVELKNAKQRVATQQIKVKTDLQSNDITVTSQYTKAFNGFVVDVSQLNADEKATKLNQIRQTSGVKSVVPNQKVKIALDLSVPHTKAPTVWATHKDAKGQNVTGKGITIAVIDTGVDYTHDDLGGCLGTNCKVIGGYDFVNEDSDPMDDQGHGTHVAATAAGKGLLDGVAPDASILAFKVLDESGNGWSDDIVAAIEYAVDPNKDGNFDDKAHVISMSLGRWGGSQSDPDVIAVQNAIDAGVVAVIAAGNDGPNLNSIGCPGCAVNAITVGAQNSDFSDVAYFSSRGFTLDGYLKPDLLAPGQDICAAKSSQDTMAQALFNYDGRNVHCIDQEHISISGTSMATPHVSGAVALLLQKKPHLTPQDVKGILMNSVHNVSESQANPDFDFSPIDYGTGALDTVNALTLESYVVAPIIINKSSGNKYTVTNKGTKPVAYKIRGFSHVDETIFSEIQNKFYSAQIEESICVQPGESEFVAFSSDLPTDLGRYIGYAEFHVDEGCDQSIESIRRLPFMFDNYEAVTVILKNIPQKEKEGYQMISLKSFNYIDVIFYSSLRLFDDAFDNQVAIPVKRYGTSFGLFGEFESVNNNDVSVYNFDYSVYHFAVKDENAVNSYTFDFSTAEKITYDVDSSKLSPRLDKGPAVSYIANEFMFSEIFASSRIFEVDTECAISDRFFEIYVVPSNVEVAFEARLIYPEKDNTIMSSSELGFVHVKGDKPNLVYAGDKITVSQVMINGTTYFKRPQYLAGGYTILDNDDVFAALGWGGKSLNYWNQLPKVVTRYSTEQVDGIWSLMGGMGIYPNDWPPIAQHSSAVWANPGVKPVSDLHFFPDPAKLQPIFYKYNNEAFQMVFSKETETMWPVSPWTFDSASITDPEGNTFEADTANLFVYVNCWNPGRSNPAIDKCKQGTYYLTMDASETFNSELKLDNYPLCWDGQSWSEGECKQKTDTRQRIRAS